MSITKTRNFLEKSGCGVIVGVALVAAFAATFFFSGQRGLNRSREGDEPVIVARVGPAEISRDFVQRGKSAMEQQMLQYGVKVSPLQAARMHSQALQGAIGTALVLELGRQKGIVITDDQLSKQIEEQVESQIQQARGSLLTTKGVTPQNWEEEFKKQAGMSVAEYRARGLEELKKQALDDPISKAQRMASLMYTQVVKASANSIQPNDADVRRSQSTLVLKPLRIDPKAGVVPAEKAKQVLAEIRSGKITFEAAMDRYSTYPVDKNKRPSDARFDLPVMSVMQDNSTYKGLDALKPNEVSDVVSQGGAATIYKLVKTTDLTQKDYEQNKAQYRERYVESLAAQKTQEEIDKLRDSVAWESLGYKLLYQTANIEGDRDITEQERKQKLQDLAKQIEGYLDDPGDDSIGSEAAEDAQYIVSESLWTSATPAEKKDLTEARIDVLRRISKNEGDVDVALNLVDLLAEKQDKEAGQNLLDAADLNSEVGPENVEYNKRIVAALPKLIKAGLITTEEQAELKKLLDDWRKMKAEDDADRKAEAERQRKEDEAAKKEADEAEKKRKADEAKQKKG